MASPGGKGIAGAERIQQPSPTLPRDSASHRRSSGPLWLQEKIFLVLYPPRSWRCTQTPLRVTWCIHPPNCSAGNRGAGYPESMQGHGYPAVWALIMTSL